MNKRRTTRYIAVMIMLFTAWIITGITGHDEGFKAMAWAMLGVSYVFWTPEEIKNKPPVKGTIQYDRKNYDVPAMRIVFTEDPLNIIKYDEVTLKIDKNADLNGLEQGELI